MADEVVPQGAPDGAAQGGESAVTPTTAPANATDAVKAFADALGWRNPDEIKQSMKALREQERLMKAALPALQELMKQQERAARAAQPAQATASTADPLAEVQRMRAEIALRDAVADRGLSREQRKLVQKLFAADHPDDVEEWLDRTIAEYLPAQPQQAVTPKKPDVASPAQPATPSPRVTDTGAPSAARGQQILSGHPSTWTEEAIKATPPAELQARLKKFYRDSGVSTGNPFADAKDALLRERHGK